MKIKKTIFRIVACANVATILVMLLLGFCGRLSPAIFPVLSTISIFFPFAILINLAFLVFWTLCHLRYVWLPVAGFLLCFIPIKTYFPLHKEQNIEDTDLKVITYNVCNFFSWKNQNEPCSIVEYLKEQDADIVCLQEMTEREDLQRKILHLMTPVYPYSDILRAAGNNGVLLAIYSKHPIRSAEIIDYVSQSNLSAAFKVNVNGKDITVINNHMETVGLSSKDKQEFRKFVEGNMHGDSIRQESKFLLGKLSEASRKRAAETDAVAEYIADREGQSIICMGDFNDHPLSYTHHRIAQLLNDCFVNTGSGFGWTFWEDHIHVRIDHIFSSTDWKPIRCMPDNKIKASDHYPVICWFKKAGKEKKTK